MNPQTFPALQDTTAAARGTESRRSGFTRLELAAVLGGLGLLALVTLPALANNRERSARVVCGNNLRLVGQACHQWSTEHSGRMPWEEYWCEGGTRLLPTAPPSCPFPTWGQGGLHTNSWFQWAWMSNELRNPKILVCPADKSKKPAEDWGFSQDGGFLNTMHQNFSVSYVMDLHPFLSFRNALLAGDRNLRGSRYLNSCSSGIPHARLLDLGQASNYGIDTTIHVEAGNFLFTDGRVEELSHERFSRRLNEVYAGVSGARAHYLSP